MDKNLKPSEHTATDQLAAVDTKSYQQSALPLCGKLIIRGKSEDSEFLQATQKSLPFALPLEPNTTATADDGTQAFWLGPEEWLIWSPTLTTHSKLQQNLGKALQGIHAAVVDVTDYYSVIAISGPNATQVLAYGCPLDLRDGSFLPTHCAQTHFRNAGILIYKTDSQHYKIQVRWSFTHYLWQFLQTVASGIKN